MKKIIFALSLLAMIMTVSFSANAIPLFPHFVDVAGDYKDGMVDELRALDNDEDVIEAPMYSAKSYYYKDLASAVSFLDDTLPFSTEKILKKEVPYKNDVKMVIYVSPMLDNVLSMLVLIDIPEQGLYVAYDEKKM